MKKQFYIKVSVDVIEDNYIKGGLDIVNYYVKYGNILADNSKEAIKQFFNNRLCFDINFDNLEYDEDNKSFCYSVLCDVGNWEIKKEYNAYKEWEKGSIKLYNHYISLYIYELTAVNTL